MEHISFAQPEIKETSQEKKLYTFVYKDNFLGGKVVFECDAVDILEADKKYQKKTGLDPARQAHVACTMLNK